MAIFNGTDANETIPGTSGDDSLSGAGGSDTISGVAGNDTLLGGDGDDLLAGGAGDDVLTGGNGVDLAYYFLASGGVVVDLATGLSSGADGADTLSSIEAVWGSNFADSIVGNAGDNLIQGHGGNDSLQGGGGTDILSYYDASGGVQINLATGTASGAAGNDSFSGFEWYVGSNTGNDTIVGDDGNNSLQGWGGNDSISGGAGDDTLEGGNGNDTLFADGGQDVVIGGLGDDVLNGGSHVATLGSDWVSYEFAAGPVVVNLATGVATGADGTDSLAAFERIRGSAFNDTLTGDGGDNILRGNGGADLIDGGGGNDAADYSGFVGVEGVIASLATNQAIGGDGTDTLLNIEKLRGTRNADSLTGNSGNNSLRGNAGNDTLDGGAGSDTAEYYNAEGPVSVNLDAGTATGADGTDSLTSIENVEGSFVFGDTLVGNSGANRLSGLGGNDSLAGGAGQDTLEGGAGNDTLDGGTILDRVNYSDLNFVTYQNAAAGVVINLSGITGTGETGSGTASDGEGGTDVLSRVNFTIGSGFNDSITGSNAQIFEQLEGGAGDDTLNGGTIDASGLNANRANYSSANGAVNVNLATGTATGGAGNDTLVNINYVRGSSHGDALTGSSSTWPEQLDGRDGDDTLSGDGGRDSLIGGAGNDVIDGGAIGDRNNYTDLNLIVYSASTGAVTVDLSGITGNGSTGTGTANDGMGGTDTLSNVNFVVGSSHGDQLFGSSALVFEEFTGGGGDDTIDGGAIDLGSMSNSNRSSYAAASGAVTVNLADGTASGAGVGNDTLIHINHVRGGAFADSLTGSDSVFAEQFEGAGGNDTIDGQGGIDLVRYDSATAAVSVNLVTGVATDGLGGTDVLVHIEGVRGSNFNDTLTGGNPANGSGGTDGFEIFVGNGGSDTIDGGAGYDRVDYNTSTAGVVATLGGSGHGAASDGLGGTDLLIGIEALRGSGFNDRLTGSDSAVFESFEGREGNDTLDGMGGEDRADYTSVTAGVVVNLATGTAQDSYGGTDTLLHIEHVRGGFHDDLITGNASANLLQGQAGHDSLLGGGGADTLHGGAGNDSLVGGEDSDWADYGSTTGPVFIDLQAGVAESEDGTDSLSGVEDVMGTAYNDSLVGDEHDNILRGNLGDDALDGGAGVDTADYSQAMGSVNVDLALGSATGADGEDTLQGINNVVGSAHGDIIVGDAGDNVLTGGAGDDTLWGGEGDDVASYSGDIADYTISSGEQAGDIVVSGPEGTDLLHEIERIRFANLEFIVIVGSAAAETLSGGLGSELISAAAGNDTVDAGGGDDAVYGESGDDSISGGAGNDVMDGGTGSDTMVGGAGDDTYFVNAGNDQVVEADGAALAKAAAGSIGGGIDKVVAGISYTLGDFVENLTLAFGTGSQAGTGNDLANELAGNEQANVLTGLLGNDTLTGGGGNDSLDGGGGTDSAMFSGSRAQYLVTQTASGYTVQDLVPGRDGTDTVANAEFLRFSDRYADLSLAGKAAQVNPAASLKTMEELYVGFFNRIPEGDGISYWIDQLNAGMSLTSVANQFYAAGVQFNVYSSSFNDAEFIAQVYDYVLGRGPNSENPPDAQGLAYWNAYLNDVNHPEQTEGTMVLQMLSDVHTFFEGITDPNHPNYPYQFVAAHLNNKATVANYYAVQLGLTMNTAADNISFGTQLAALITPESYDAAIALIGVPIA